VTAPKFIVLYIATAATVGSPPSVDMSITQHLSLWGFLAFTAIDTNVLTSLIPPPASKKNQSPFPRPTYHDGKPDGGMFGDYDAGFVATLTPSTISRFWASDIPAE